MRQIYLDYNATTPIASEVRQAMTPFLEEHFGNPSSSHALGQVCRDAVEQARGHVATLIGAMPEEIYFTSGGTESNNLVIKGVFYEPGNRTGQFVTSCFEHPAIQQPAKFHQASGGEVCYVDTDSQGVVMLESLEDAIGSHTRLVSVMHANNEIGTIQPIREISEICSKTGIPLHTDAAQSVGKINTKVDDLGVDFLTIAGHKIYAPKGIGALYIRKGRELVPSIHGANHERGVRPGTENVPYIVGLGMAAKLAHEKEDEFSSLAKLRDRMQQVLVDRIGPGLSINGGQADRLPNTCSVNFPGVAAIQLLRKVPQLCLSTGAACHADTVSLSDTLRAIGLPETTGAGTVRISCGRYTTLEEIETAANLLVSAWEDCHGSN